MPLAAAQTAAQYGNSAALPDEYRNGYGGDVGWGGGQGLILMAFTAPPPPVHGVPTLSLWGLPGLGGLMGAVAGFTRKRRPKFGS